jgi:hypothetical protein
VNRERRLFHARCSGRQQFFDVARLPWKDISTNGSELLIDKIGLELVGESTMPYFSSRQDGLQRGAKVLADIACAVLLATF